MFFRKYKVNKYLLSIKIATLTYIKLLFFFIYITNYITNKYKYVKINISSKEELWEKIVGIKYILILFLEY